MEDQIINNEVLENAAEVAVNSADKSSDAFGYLVLVAYSVSCAALGYWLRPRAENAWDKLKNRRDRRRASKTQDNEPTEE